MVKVLEGGLESGLWYQSKFQNWDGSPDLWPARIPATLKSGLYIVRHEILSIHIAKRPQFYPECAHLNISGTGTALPPERYLARFPGAYANDGMRFSFYLCGNCRVVLMRLMGIRSVHLYRYLRRRHEGCHGMFILFRAEY